MGRMKETAEVFNRQEFNREMEVIMREIDKQREKHLQRRFQEGLAIGAFSAILLVIIFGAIFGG